MPKYSVIVPVYNRPDEIDELLDSLARQTFNDFEVLIIEDGSSIPCNEIVQNYQSTLSINYFPKENSGQGFSRNYGFQRAAGEWLIVFDSDCIIPEYYFDAVESYLKNNHVDGYGGPDRAHEGFSPVQKAISYSMTSVFTTGGIRGNKKHLGTYHPRSFNMGIHKDVFKKTGGYILTKKGEDLEFSIRIMENGFKMAFIEEAYVYHKRRTNFRQFFQQLHFFGTARINVFRFYPKTLKLMYFFPSAFFLGMLITIACSPFLPSIGLLGSLFYALYFLVILRHATVRTNSLKIGLLSVASSFIQLSAYGLGFIKEGLLYLRKG